MPQKKAKVRLDVLVVERGLLDSRQAAQAAIIDGGVLVDGVKIDKPGAAVSACAQLSLTRQWQPGKYVSRGGLKLEKALSQFQISVEGRVCLDIGASTGGFTDCLLKQGARHVYAIDVGYGQLSWQLRQNPQVTVKERVNARYLGAEQLYQPEAPWASLAVLDVSFISLTKVLPACLSLLDRPKEVVALIKPQFEAGRGEIGKGGVVKSAAVHESVLNSVIACARQLHVVVRGLTYSPLKGPSGNIEFLMYLTEEREGLSCAADIDVAFVVAAAHGALD